jgi:hypothetical protein
MRLSFGMDPEDQMDEYSREIYLEIKDSEEKYRYRINERFEKIIEELNREKEDLKTKLSEQNEIINKIMQIIIGKDEDDVKVEDLNKILFPE